ncbi:MAG: monovalent cation/H(+) antiporter subunit G [Xanthobacteraceae bacterium]|nr:monovalent cation/H(+) antiporter subunit G [Xanthobacteraceae bacterium]
MKHPDLHAMISVLVALLLLIGAGMTFIGALGLIRLRRSFYERVHAPTLGTTLGTICIALASLIYFSATGSVSVHELLIVIFITVTTPVSLVVLVKATAMRDASETKSKDR